MFKSVFIAQLGLSVLGLSLAKATSEPEDIYYKPYVPPPVPPKYPTNNPLGLKPKPFVNQLGPKPYEYDPLGPKAKAYYPDYPPQPYEPPAYLGTHGGISPNFEISYI